MNGAKKVTCSCPSKVLVVGGYLVLDPAYTGFVISLSARIFATVQISSSDEEGSSIVVTSPQFDQAVWKFSLDQGNLQPVSETDNAYVRETLQIVLSYFRIVEPLNLEIEIHADQEYYSQAGLGNSRFPKFATKITETPKTGLGSSAALIASLAGALYLHFSDQQGLLEEDLWRIHNLAQIAHCAAQGKVGSGFDVASAVFGPCTYRRFGSELLKVIPVDTQSVQDLVDLRWDMDIMRTKLRPGLKLIMGDVSKGSSTPGMVKKVTASSEALDVWDSLALSNELLAEKLTSVMPYSRTEQSSIRDICTTVRGLMKAMGEAAKVEIEPDQQTSLLDATIQVEGVVACGVPGAGGYDAVFAIIEDSDTTTKAVEDLWKSKGVYRLNVYNDTTGLQIEAQQIAVEA